MGRAQRIHPPKSNSHAVPARSASQKQRQAGLVGKRPGSIPIRVLRSAPQSGAGQGARRTGRSGCPDPPAELDIGSVRTASRARSRGQALPPCSHRDLAWRSYRDLNHFDHLIRGRPRKAASYPTGGPGFEPQPRSSGSPRARGRGGAGQRAPDPDSQPARVRGRAPSGSSGDRNDRRADGSRGRSGQGRAHRCQIKKKTLILKILSKLYDHLENCFYQNRQPAIRRARDLHRPRSSRSARTRRGHRDVGCFSRSLREQSRETVRKTPGSEIPLVFACHAGLYRRGGSQLGRSGPSPIGRSPTCAATRRRTDRN